MESVFLQKWLRNYGSIWNKPEKKLFQNLRIFAFINFSISFSQPEFSNTVNAYSQLSQVVDFCYSQPVDSRMQSDIVYDSIDQVVSRLIKD